MKIPVTEDLYPGKKISIHIGPMDAKSLTLIYRKHIKMVLQVCVIFMKLFMIELSLFRIIVEMGLGITEIIASDI
jgi:hypothetical protein